MSGALFLPDGDADGGSARYSPTQLAAGPWYAEALHGGPVAALLARAVENCEPSEELEVSRLTMELLRPVPSAPLTVEARVIRPGRKVQWLDVSMRHGEVELARARALRIRRAPVPIPEGDVPRGRPDVGPESATPGIPLSSGVTAYHTEGAELRFVGGRFEERGPATVWIRLRVPVVAGEDPSPLQRVAAAADFGNGVSSVLDFESHLFINPDLTIHLHRLPKGEWVCLDAKTHLQADGVGLAESQLYDQRGPIGRSLQSLLIDRR
ncbi:MAG: thioesterase family protein [Acidimicrobiales bacterium]